MSSSSQALLWAFSPPLSCPGTSSSSASTAWCRSNLAIPKGGWENTKAQASNPFVRPGHSLMRIVKCLTYMHLARAAMSTLIPWAHLLAQCVCVPAQAGAAVWLPCSRGRDSCSRLSLSKAFATPHLCSRFSFTQYSPLNCQPKQSSRASSRRDKILLSYPGVQRWASLRALRRLIRAV